MLCGSDTVSLDVTWFESRPAISCDVELFTFPAFCREGRGLKSWTETRLFFFLYVTASESRPFLPSASYYRSLFDVA